MWKWIWSVALVAAVVIGTPDHAASNPPSVVQQVRLIADSAQTARDIADLQAQQTAAHWTKVAAFASITGVGVSIVGLFAIWRQLGHSASAVKEASRSSRAAADAAKAAILGSRPWLKIVNGSAQFHQDEDPPELVLSFVLANVGATPAIMAISHIAYIAEPSQALVEEAIRALGERDLANGATVFPGEELRTTESLLLPNGATSQTWIVALLISYRMAGSTTNHTSGAVLGVRANTDEYPHTGDEGEMIWDTHVHLERRLRVDAT